MSFRLSGWRKPAVLLLALSAGGCETVQRIPRPHPWPTRAHEPARGDRERAMNQQWQNRSFDELVRSLGQPRLVMTIPGGGSPPSFAVVYGIDPGSGCIDAFAVSVDDTAAVRIYHCR